MNSYKSARERSFPAQTAAAVRIPRSPTRSTTPTASPMRPAPDGIDHSRALTAAARVMAGPDSKPGLAEHRRGAMFAPLVFSVALLLPKIAFQSRRS